MADYVNASDNVRKDPVRPVRCYSCGGTFLSYALNVKCADCQRRMKRHRPPAKMVYRDPDPVLMEAAHG